MTGWSKYKIIKDDGDGIGLTERYQKTIVNAIVQDMLATISISSNKCNRKNRNKRLKKKKSKRKQTNVSFIREMWII